MRVIFIHHSCFLVEVDEKVLIFDWFAGDRVQGYHFGGVIPEYAPDTPVYVFASHKHRDHFDMDVLRWGSRYPRIRYIFSKDCKMTPRFLARHGIDPAARGRITYVAAGETYKVDDLAIETLRSTDAGVAFYVETRGAAFFHAGDLNDWRWEGVGELIHMEMGATYKAQIRKLSGKKIHLAFVPLDPRLKENQGLGLSYFLAHTDADYVFPMHMWQDYTGIAEFKKQISNAAMAERIVDIKCENQIFEIREE